MVTLGTVGLQRFALIRVAVNIWHQQKWNEIIQKVLFDDRKKESTLPWESKWTTMTQKAFVDVNKLNLPPTTIDQLEFMVEVIGYELLAYLRYHKETYSHESSRIRVEEIVWTSFGTVDKVQTHYNLSHHYAMSYTKFTCPICVDKAIFRVGVQIMRNKRLASLTKVYLSSFISFWGDIVKTGVRKLHFTRDSLNFLGRVRSVNEKMTVISAQEGNVELFVYFWKKLNDSQRVALIPVLIDIFNNETIRCQKYVSLSEIILFIINDVDEEKRQHIIRQCSFTLINGLLEKWPYYGIVVNQFDRIIPYLSPTDYKKILLEILKKMHYIETTRVKHRHYREEFKLLWGNMEYYVARGTSEFMNLLQHRLDN